MSANKESLQGEPTKIFERPKDVARELRPTRIAEPDNVLRFRAHQEGPEKDEVIATEFEIKNIEHLGEFSAGLLTEIEKDDNIKKEIRDQLDAIIEFARADLRLRHNDLEKTKEELLGGSYRQIPLDDSNRDIQYEQIWRQIVDRKNELRFLRALQNDMSDVTLLGSFRWIDKKIRTLDVVLNSLDAQRQKRAEEISQ